MTVPAKNLNDYFDGSYYLSEYPDVAEAKIDPFEHFCSVGWKEKRNPSVAFDTGFYLRQYPDIAAANINPLIHYIAAGQFEGRKIMPPLREMRLRVQHSLWSRNYRSEGYDPEIPTDGILSVSKLMVLLSDTFRDAPTVVSVSHDDYGVNVGGVQKLLSVEEARCEDLSWNYMHLAPSCHRLGLAQNAPGIPVVLTLRLNGKKLGNVTPSIFLQSYGQIKNNKHPVFSVIHHLMGHNPEEIADLIDGMSSEKTIIWAHDYFTICSGIQLMRNDVVYCDAPSAESMACNICSHGQDRLVFTKKIADFFSRFEPVVMAPSQSAADLWRKHSPYSYRAVYGRPLGELVLSDSRVSFRNGSKNEPIRIAFFGYRTHLKGWNTFQMLAMKFKDDSRYEFHHLGMAQNVAASGNIIYTPVSNSRRGEEAMIFAAVSRNIDVVINWALWPETFCYAAYEAVAAGAFLLAPTGSGNVSALIEKLGADHGLLLHSEDELISLMTSDKLCKIMRLSNRKRGYISPSGDSVSWLLENADHFQDIDFVAEAYS